MIKTLASVSGERFDVAPLSFSVDGVKSEGRLAGAGESRNYDEAIARDVDVDVLEVVLASAPYTDAIYSDIEYQLF